MPYIITTREPERFSVVIDHPDAPVAIYDRSQPDEPCVCIAANADEADSWVQDRSTSRRAVATLEIARQRVWEIANSSDPSIEGPVRACRSITENGGTVGPLPDGTTIQVERVEWRAIIESAGIVFDYFEGPVEDAIDAYNAAQS